MPPAWAELVLLPSESAGRSCGLTVAMQPGETYPRAMLSHCLGETQIVHRALNRPACFESEPASTSL